jgi:hypothetical protein
VFPDGEEEDPDAFSETAQQSHEIGVPFLYAKPGKVCLTLSGGELQIVHVARVQAAAKKDATANREAKKH